MSVKPFKYLLNISKDYPCSRVIQKIGVDKLGKSSVIKAESPSEALLYLNKIGMTDETIPFLIFLSTEEMAYSDLKDFLELLDRDYREAARGRVVILNHDLTLNEYIKLAICESVLQTLNCPVLPREVEIILQSFKLLKPV